MSLHPVLLSLLLVLVGGHVDPDCGEGQVRDLDGSCVVKFQIPKKKSECPKVTLDNGDIFLLMSGRMVQFYCDTGYVRVPDTEVAICQVQGTWSKVVPVCLMPGCQVPDVPSSGGVYLPPEYNYTIAQYHCGTGYTMSGTSTLACIDGTTWNGTKPQCNMVLDMYSDQHTVIVPSGTSGTSGSGTTSGTTILVTLYLAVLGGIL